MPKEAQKHGESVEKISFLQSGFDLFVGHNVLQRNDHLAGCGQFIKVLREGAGAENNFIVAGSALAFGNGAMTKLSGFDLVLFHDLFDRVLHHQGRTGTVCTACKQFFVVKFCHLSCLHRLFIGLGRC